MEDKKKKTVGIVLAIFVLVAVIGISYAFITQILTGTKEVVVSAGVLDLVLEEENEITISDALPMYDEVGMIQDAFVFRLVNNGSDAVNYEVKLVDITPDTIVHKCSDLGEITITSPSECRKVEYSDALRSEALSYCSLTGTEMGYTVTTEAECTKMMETIGLPLDFEGFMDIGVAEGEFSEGRELVETYPDNSYTREVSKLSEWDVKYGLTKDGTSTIRLLSNLDSDGVIDSGTIGANSETIEYELRLWIKDTVTDSSEISGATLSYRIDVEIEQIPEKKKVVVAGQRFTVEESNSTSQTTNVKTVYEYEEDGKPIYYWKGNVTDNHVIFGGFCWEMVRTTSTGGVKMIYDGEPVEVDGVKTCPNTGNNSQLATASQFDSTDYVSHLGYMYGNTEYRAYFMMDDCTSCHISQSGIKYGNDVEWKLDEETGKYVYELKPKEGGSLFESTGTWSTDYTSVADGNHYTCVNTTGVCSEVSYIYSIGDFYVREIGLTDGIKIEEALEQLYSNDQDSTIKENIETWFESTDLDEEDNLSKLEDTVYCNDRSISDESTNGWNKDTNVSQTTYFSSYTRRMNRTPDLSCRVRSDNRDRFTYQDTINGNGKLEWPVGLITTDEIDLAGGTGSYLYTGQSYWTLSPFSLSYIGAEVYSVGSSSWTVTSERFVRPVISLSSEVEFQVGGEGTESNPFEVK